MTSSSSFAKAGLDITHDPFRLRFEGTSLYTDLGADRSTGAERGNEKILVEFKFFVGVSDINSLINAIGRCQLYKAL